MHFCIAAGARAPAVGAAVPVVVVVGQHPYRRTTVGSAVWVARRAARLTRWETVPPMLGLSVWYREPWLRR